MGLRGFIVQELRESRGGRMGCPPPNEPSGFCGRKAIMIEGPCFGIGHSLSLICQLASEDIKYHFIIIGLSGLPKIPALGKFCRSQPVLTAGRWR